MQKKTKGEEACMVR